MATRTNPVTTRGLYRQWEPDPRVVDLSTLIWQDGRSFAKLAEAAGLAPATVEAIAYLETKRPQGLTEHKLLQALGVTLTWTLRDGTVYRFLTDHERAQHTLRPPRRKGR